MGMETRRSSTHRPSFINLHARLKKSPRFPSILSSAERQAGQFIPAQAAAFPPVAVNVDGVLVDAVEIAVHAHLEAHAGDEERYGDKAEDDIEKIAAQGANERQNEERTGTASQKDDDEPKFSRMGDADRGLFHGANSLAL